MADYSKYISLVAQCLQDDAVLNALVDGQIVPHFRRANADQYLTAANQACVGVRNLNLRGDDLPGAAYHSISDYDQLMEFHLIQLASDDCYLSSVAHEIGRIMKSPLTKTIGGISYSVSTLGRINFMPVDDDQFNDRVQITGTCRLRYLDA